MVGGKVVIIEYIKPVYGAPEADGYARVYQSEKKAREVEAKHIIDRNLKKGGEEAEEKKEEAKEGKEEKPAEEAKGEKSQPESTPETKDDGGKKEKAEGE